MPQSHCDLKVSRSQAKILPITSIKSKQVGVRAVKSKSKTVRHFKVNPVSKLDETFYEQAESM